MLRYLPFVLILAVWIYAFIDCLNTPENEVRKLPKVVWVIIILLFGQVLVGPVAWFAAGRPRRNAPVRCDAVPTSARWVAPDDNPEFLKSINDSKSSNGSGADEEPVEEQHAEDGEGETRAASGSEGEAAASPVRRAGHRPPSRPRASGGRNAPPRGGVTGAGERHGRRSAPEPLSGAGAETGHWADAAQPTPA